MDALTKSCFASPELYRAVMPCTTSDWILSTGLPSLGNAPPDRTRKNVRESRAELAFFLDDSSVSIPTSRYASVYCLDAAAPAHSVGTHCAV